MACSDAAVILEALPRMTLVSGSGSMEQLKGKELAFNCSFVFADVKNTSGDSLDLEKEVAAFVQKVMKDKLQFSILKDGTPSHTGKLAVAIDEIQKTGKAAAVIQAEKMDKARVEVQTEKLGKALVDGEEVLVETGKESVAIAENPTVTEERCADSDPPAGKYRLYADGDYVRTILAMPRELPCAIPYSSGDNLAEFLGISEECLQKRRQVHMEAAARADRISNEFALFQERVREESDRLGYFEVDDEYLDGVAKLQEYSEQLGKDPDFEFCDLDGCEPAEELCCVR